MAILREEACEACLDGRHEMHDEKGISEHEVSLAGEFACFCAAGGARVVC